MFSKVSQSLALVNSVSTLLNKGGIACRRPTASQDFCASAKQTQTLTATLLQPCTSRHERKRGSAVTAAGKASEQHALLHGCSQASSRASKLILCQRKLPQHAKTCQNMPPQCSCLSMHKTVKVCEKLSSRKSFLKEVRNSTVARESLRANKRSPTFLRGEQRSRALLGLPGARLDRGRGETEQRALRASKALKGPKKRE